MQARIGSAFRAATPGEGASTLGSEFARVAARVADSRVLLVDADRTQLTTATNFRCPTELASSTKSVGRVIEGSLVTSPENRGSRSACYAASGHPAVAKIDASAVRAVSR